VIHGEGLNSRVYIETSRITDFMDEQRSTKVVLDGEADLCILLYTSISTMGNG